MTGYVVFAHGSSVESANEAVRTVTAQLRERGDFQAVEAAFLEGGSPDLRGAVEVLISRGVESVVVIPYFLTLGLHLQRDLPRLIREIESAHPGLSVDVTPPLDGHPAMIDALLDRAQGSCKQN
ncbi:MAG TPA: CbiX/SirB N-terminal domain-containing protein [Bryobacteraceae bacterium]|jgi:sirohydrochlorin ferrochelatase|nr:CbiX/SirB N-terminal domain-containing protein [Bryobacteraceae bacterium]